MKVFSYIKANTQVSKAPDSAGGGWYILHPSNDAILAHVTDATEREANLVARAIELVMHTTENSINKVMS